MSERILASSIPSHTSMKPGVVVVHLVEPHTVSAEWARACLTIEEKSRADRFRFQQDALHWTACRASLRMILGDLIQLPPQEVPLVYLEFGKPVLAAPYDDLHFNLSHCASLAAIALSGDGPVGIDLEEKARAADLLECESTFCHPSEVLRLPEQQDKRSLELLRIWTAKEAILKALGTGLSFSPVNIETSYEKDQLVIHPDHSILNTENQQINFLTDSRLNDHQTVVSCLRSIQKIEITSS